MEATRLKLQGRVASWGGDGKELNGRHGAVGDGNVFLGQWAAEGKGWLWEGASLFQGQQRVGGWVGMWIWRKNKSMGPAR